MLELFKHNKDAYNSVLKSWKNNKRTCVVHATGTGKSLIIAKIIVENPKEKHLFLSPSTLIFDELKKHLRNNIKSVNFLTYQYLLNKDITLFKGYDYIYLDEFHRVGAEKWSKSLDALLKQNPDAKILGTSATHIRYLDNNKNMAEILFNGNISSKLTLKDSIEKKIHKKPIYVTALYKIENFIEISKRKIENLNITEDKKKIELNKLYNLKINWEKSKGIDFILNKHLSKERKKIIIFCNNTKHLEESRNLLDAFFINYFGRNLNILEVNSKLSKKKNEDTLKIFNNNNCSILYCIDMLNEGIHVDNVDTCILLRETSSSIVYFQQIGRVFKVNQERNPLIFDMVNNFKNANTKSDFIELLENKVKKTHYNHNVFNQSKKDELLVEFHDEIKDFVQLFQNLDNIEWEEKLKLIKEYFNKYNHLPKSNSSLGIYVLNLKHKYRINRLSKKDIDDLLKITPLFFNYINDLAWNKNYELLKNYYLVNNFLPITKDNIGIWLHKQKQKYKNNLLSDEYIEKLIEIDDTIFNQFRNDLVDSRFNENIEQLKIYFKINNKFPPQSTKLGIWLANIKFRDSLSMDLKEEIIKLNPNFFKNKLDCIWNENFNKFKDYYLKHEKIPSQSSQIGTWIAGIKQSKNKLKLSEEKVELLLKICPDFFKSKKEIDFENWNMFYNQVKEYYLEYKDLPKIKNNGNIGHWINYQKTYFNKNKLEKEKVELLLKICPDFFKSKKEIDFENWILIFNQVKEYYSSNNKLPTQSTKIGKWLILQRMYIKNNKLDKEKVNMFKSIINN